MGDLVVKRSPFKMESPLECPKMHVVPSIHHKRPFSPQISEVSAAHKPYSPRIEAAKEMLRLVDVAPVRRLATLAPEVAELYELDAARDGSAIDKPLKHIRPPSGGLFRWWWSSSSSRQNILQSW